MMAQPVSVLKIGGSVLTGRLAYRRVAAFIEERLCSKPGEKLIAVVSAENGTTDALQATAREIVADPDPKTLDLLWSTGETQAAALLTLFLQASGIRAAAANIHQTGLAQPDSETSPGAPAVRPLRLRALLNDVDVVVAPGFLSRGDGDGIVSLGRGGSDLTAVLLAAGLGAARCELVKDVPGYFSSDPKRDPDARPLAAISYAKALEMADDGCGLVQRQALVAARDSSLPLVIRSLGSGESSIVS